MNHDITRFVIRLAKNVICRYVCKMWKNIFDKEYGIRILYIQDFVHSSNAFNWVKGQANIVRVMDIGVKYGNITIIEIILSADYFHIYGYFRNSDIIRRGDLELLAIWNKRRPFNGDYFYSVAIQYNLEHVILWGIRSKIPYDMEIIMRQCKYKKYLIHFT